MNDASSKWWSLAFVFRFIKVPSTGRLIGGPVYALSQKRNTSVGRSNQAAPGPGPLGAGLLPVRGTVAGNYRKVPKFHGNEGNYRQ